MNESDRRKMAWREKLGEMSSDEEFAENIGEWMEWFEELER